LDGSRDAAAPSTGSGTATDSGTANDSGTATGPETAKTPGAATGSATSIRDLDRIAWAGGPEYWRQFPNATEWTDPAFFPIGIWHGGIASADEVAWDKRHGINTYVEMWEGTPFSMIEENDVYWVGRALNAT